MEKKTECEIVQDLLLSYVDDVLNESSRRLVEKHLIECEICQEKWKEIKKDIMENEKMQKKEIDYLKKIRRKSRIKSFFLAIGIIAFIGLFFYLRQFIIVLDITKKEEKSLQSNNFYQEKREIISNQEVSVIKIYYKDGKCKKVWETYTDQGEETNSIQYSNKNSEETITILPRENQVIIETGEVNAILNHETNIKGVSSICADDLISKLGMAFVKSIQTDTYEIGREYYVLKNRFERNQNWETWIDKETGLPLKIINRNAISNFFPGTDIVKEERDMVQDCKYQFDIVTEEDVEIPDLSTYEKKYLKEHNFIH